MRNIKKNMIKDGVAHRKSELQRKYYLIVLIFYGLTSIL